MRVVTVVLSIAALAFFLPTLPAQVLLNCNFENNTAGIDRINIANATFNGYMANNTGFGTWSGVGNLDIIRSTSYGLGPQSGVWYIALTGGGTDRVAMETSAPLVAGNSYTLSYYDNQWSTFTAPEVRVGISNSPTSLGTFLYMGGSPVSGTWTLRTVTFTAPITGNYITIETNGAASGSVWTKVDNFALAVPLPVSSVVLGAERVGTTDKIRVAGTLGKENEQVKCWLERAADAGEFVTIGELAPENIGDQQFDFAVEDELISFNSQSYRIKMMDANGVIHFSDRIEMNTQVTEPEFLVYPNPSNGEFSLFYRHPLVEDAVSVEVYDLKGALLHNQKLDRNSPLQILDVRFLEPGLYLLNLVSGGFRQCTKVLIE